MCAFCSIIVGGLNTCGANTFADVDGVQVSKGGMDVGLRGIV